MDLNDIPQNKTSGFPTGVSEHTYASLNECKAFVDGVNHAQDTDVETGTPFERKTSFQNKTTRRRSEWVVRVRVGDWGDEDDEDDEENPAPVNFDKDNYLDTKVEGKPVFIPPLPPLG